MKEPFKADLQAIQRRARDKMSEGAVTGAYKADREKVDRKSTRLNSSHSQQSRMPSSA